MKNEIAFTEGMPLITKVFWIVSLVAIIGTIYLIGNKAIKTIAVTGCMQAARLETTSEDKEKVTIPENYWYEKCLDEAGYTK